MTPLDISPVPDEIWLELPVPEKSTRKLIYFQQIEFEDTRKIEYRFTYYMVGLKPGARGPWVFGQYSLLIPAEHLSCLLAEARRRGWPGIV
jgi:hypothetical protein